MKHLLLVIVSFLFILSAQAAWEDYMDPQKLGLPDVKDLQLPWHHNPEYTSMDPSNPRPENLQHEEVNCASDSLWPTHPQEMTKDYAYAVTASYRRKKHSDANVVIMSDFFEDECGNIYKGFWTVPFLADAESMQTLLSKGRSIMLKPHGFPGEYIAGGSYRVKAKDFIFFTIPSSEDMWKIEESRKAAKREGLLLIGHRWIREMK